MLGSFSSEQNISIIGGGIAGLLLAWHLDRQGRKVTLFEAADRCGGLIESTRLPQGLVEHAAHSILATPPVLELCRELDVELVSTREEARTRFILRDGEVHPAMRVLGPLEWAGLIRRALFIKGVGQDRTQSMADWAARHLGHPARDFMLAPFLLGIYGAFGHETGVCAAFPDMSVATDRSLFSVMRARKRKRKGRKSAMMAPRDGMQSLVDALSERLQGSSSTTIVTGKPITELPKNGDVAICTPAGVAGQLLQPVCAVSSQALQSISYVPLISVTCFYEKADCHRIPSGIGVLIPPSENHDVLGILFPSMFFDNRADDDHVALAVMLGGSVRPDLVERNDEEIEKIVRAELSNLYRIDASPVSIRISRYPKAIPLYSPDDGGNGLLETLDVVRQNWASEPGRVLFGNYTGQVSVRGMIEACAEVFG